ncbi:ovoinhibitor isoform X2 [Procambarus clarkii]|uniref:ovoinhibitor isoform X2 n=1 Tax=Procambarus clarkii TaxID=6728 RepID=UPI001E675EA9|nr:ovoinhibitor-like isoform X2 [Procambarus clarkii]
MVRLVTPFATLVLVTLAVASPQRPTDLLPEKLDKLKEIFEAVTNTGGGGDCPDDCPDTVKPVCGSNSVLYRNDCSLARVACRDPTLSKRNDGPCFATQSPPTGSRPSGGSTINASTQCREECTKIYMPVCGTDGRTYNNKCILEAESCKSRNSGGRGIGIAAEGVCKNDTCQTNCGDSYQPVCGTNGVTYSNRCELTAAACRNATISQRSEGACPPSTSRVHSVTVSSVQVPPIPSAPVTTGPDCPDTCNPGFRPVCGSDGQVYGSECKLNLARCKNSNPSLVKKNDGVCTKDCSIVCYEDDEPVCGSNKVTYINDCFLAVARCKDRSISKVSNGACNTTVRPVCALQCDEVSNPVCGSDGGTYNNNCQLLAASCYYRGLIKLYDGRCKANSK